MKHCNEWERRRQHTGGASLMIRSSYMSLQWQNTNCSLLDFLDNEKVKDLLKICK